MLLIVHIFWNKLQKKNCKSYRYNATATTKMTMFFSFCLLRDSVTRYVACLKFCLKFNIAKTKVMVFGQFSRLVPSLTKISINGELIEYVEKCKYLG